MRLRVRRMSKVSVRRAGSIQRTMDDRIYIRGLINMVASRINTPINTVYYRIKDIKVEGNGLPLTIIVTLEVERGELYGA